MSNFEKQIKEMVDKAAKASQSHEAMQFTQAALNAAHAEQVLSMIHKK